MHTHVKQPRVRFGRFELDPSQGELYRDGRRVRLQEHPRQVLIALLERPGEVVTREDLRERLWKSDTFVDFEHGLNTAVKKARQALGDSAETPKFIETLARRGYRFIGQVDPLDSRAGLGSDRGQTPDAAPTSPATADMASRWATRRVLWLTVVLLLVAGGIGLWIALRGGRTENPRPLVHAAAAQLAVMPLQVLTESPTDSSYVGVGIADAITTKLAATRQIALRPTSAVLPFKDGQSDPARVAAALGVQHLLLGTIQPTDRTYRVSVQLVRADGVAVWGRTFDEPRAELLALQDQIAEQIASALRIELSPPERARLHVRYTNNPAAYDMYLRGRSLLVNYTEANMREAIGYFEKALALDRDYALARAGIATATAWFSVRYSHDNEALAWGKRADDEARRALEQDGSLADAHFAIASAAGTAYRGFEWKVVLDRSAAALSLDPSLDLAHLARMRAYYHLGLFDEGREEGRRAGNLNPSPNVERSRLEVALQLFGGDYKTAVEHATALVARTDAPAARHYLGLARYYDGDPKGGREMLASVMRRGSPDVRAQASLASLEAATGMRQEARARLAAVLRGPEMDHHIAYSAGAAFAQLGDSDASLKWLEQAAKTGFPCYPWFERDSLLDPVRSHPRFVRLIGHLREAHQQARRHIK